MMKSTFKRARRAFGMATVVALLGSVAAAQGTLISPAETPPASFKGSQYVDSRGCVFIRAGIGRRSTWVPRVSRNRKPICNSAARVAAVPQAKPLVQSAPKRTPFVGAPIRTVASAPAQRRMAPKPVAAKPAARVLVAVAPVPTASTQKRRIAMRADGVQTYYTQTACTQSRNGSARDMVSTYRSAVECGRAIMPGRVVGQSARIVRGSSAVRTAQPRRVAAAAPLTASTVAIPKHLYKTPAERGTDLGVPAGYKPIWEDDRLNPARGIGTLGGMSKMDLIWTRTLPRRLINRATGEQVDPGRFNLIYPFTDHGMQREYLAAKSKYQVQVGSKTGKVRLVPRANARPVVSTRSAPARRVAPPAPKGARFVQVGSFSNPANAQRTAQRLANAGLPVRMSTGRLKTVLAGPFSSQAQVSAALGKVRRAGFRDAFVRR